MNPVLRTVLQRLGLGIATLFVVSIIISLAIEMLPGDFARAILGQSATPETVAAFQKEVGLDRSPVVRYFDWIGGVLQGPATDLGIEAQHMLRLRDRLYKLMADYTGKTPEQIHRDFDRNKWLFADEAVAYGCADRIIDQAPEVITRNGDDSPDSKG